MGLLKPHAVTQGWVGQGDGGEEGLLQTPPGRVCIWDMPAAHPSLNLHLPIYKMGFLESQGMAHRVSLIPLPSPGCTQGPIPQSELTAAQAQSSEGNESRR